ncbi:MAG: formate dehydrogenase accessory sulfurtransferase FdhD [Desulfuromonadales bacterium]|nr:formate dehydrogenase accessory sulfurtransferase FdhD [Desulfuromonadales bacterium]
MDNAAEFGIARLEQGNWRCETSQTVQEFPLKLVVNGRDLVTLTASPHQLNQLAIGFLRLQGFIDQLSELQSLGVCADSGIAEARISKDVSTELTPTLTSGCGGGIAFNLPVEPPSSTDKELDAAIAPQSIFKLMQSMTSRSERYRSHGGIHSAALGLDGEILLHAEDIGRHNTLDRIAGQALLEDIPMQGQILVTSGRISSEMAAKAARLELALIASRTAVTDAAIKICRQYGITLIGYLRKDSMNIYAWPQRLIGSGRLVGANPR